MHDPGVNEAFRLPGNWPGLLRAGNINLDRRPIVHNRNGSYSTVDSTSFNVGGHEVLLPQVVDGKVVSALQALREYFRTGGNLGTFANVKAADRYAEQLHNQQALAYAAAAGRR